MAPVGSYLAFVMVLLVLEPSVDRAGIFVNDEG